MATKVSDLVKSKIGQIFAPKDADFVLMRLNQTELPLSPDYERIFLAVLKLSGNDLEKFEGALELAKIDWRDVLVAAGMANWNWRATLESEGFI